MLTRVALAVAAQLPMASTALAQTMTDEPAITRRAGDTTSKAACVLFVAFELPVDSVPVKRK